MSRKQLFLIILISFPLLASAQPEPLFAHAKKYSDPLAEAIADNDSTAVVNLIRVGQKPTVSHVRQAANIPNNYIVRALIQAGAPAENPNDKIGAQPLFVALIKGDEDVVDTLLRAGINMNKKYKTLKYGTTTIPEYATHHASAVEMQRAKKILEKEKYRRSASASRL